MLHSAVIVHVKIGMMAESQEGWACDDCATLQETPNGKALNEHKGI